MIVVGELSLWIALLMATWAATVSFAGGVTRRDWDGIWYLRTSIDELGWVAEMRIPFNAISFNTTIDTWGFNFGRTIRRNQETVRWASPRLNTFVQNVGDAGDMIGLLDLRQGRGITFRPFGATKFDLDDSDITSKPGFDLFYQVTPSITAALTVNTDFAEAEVDQRQVNLTRFPLSECSGDGIRCPGESRPLEDP